MVSDQWHAGDHIPDATISWRWELLESNDGKRNIQAKEPQQGRYHRGAHGGTGQCLGVERIGLYTLLSLQKAVDGYVPRRSASRRRPRGADMR